MSAASTVVPVSGGYKALTVLMVIVCVLNVAVLIVALVMFAFAYRAVTEGKTFDKIDAALKELSGTLNTSLTQLGAALVGGASPFFVDTANTVFWRFDTSNKNKFSINDFTC